MKIAVVFDTLVAGLEDADFKREIEQQIYEAEYDVAEALMQNGHDVFMIGFQDDLVHLLERLEHFEPELVFNCTESFNGKARYDYAVAAVLEMKGYRYTGSPPEALLLARDKATSKKILAYQAVMIPSFAVYAVGETVRERPDLEFPLIVKPMHEDASVGIAQSSVVSDVSGLAERVGFIHRKLKQPAIAERFIEGREIYAGLLGNGDPMILPLVEVAFDKVTDPCLRVATYSAKWDLDYRERWGIKNVFARRISERARAEIERVCRIAFDALELRDYGRVDMRLTSDQEVYVLEVNPNPYIAFGEDMANSAERAGLDYNRFIERIVEEAAARYERQ
jgi:D-alanine-D-alanine ligase